MSEPESPDPGQLLDPAHELVSSRRVEGTPVYGKEGERLGTIRSLMIQKHSGDVAYAMLSLTAFLGTASQVHPIPWNLLRYDVDRDGYVIDVTRERLERAPSFTLDSADRPREPSEDDEVFAYYGALPPWGRLP